MAHQKVKRKISPLPYSYYFFVVTFIALIGLLDAIYLSISHYRVYTDIGYESFCAISRSLNCDTVSQSPYSILIGVPVPVWGIIGFTFFLILLVFAWHPKAEKKRMWTLLSGLSLLFTGYSIVLAIISTYMIQSYCIMCILSYAVNLLLLYFSWLIRKRFDCEPIAAAVKLDVSYLISFPKTIIPIILVFGAGTVMILSFFPPYWKMDTPVLTKKMPTGITVDGHPWIGSTDPELVIVEFSDYRCFQCKKMHYFLRRIIQEYPDKIRLVHRHFPMDNTINPIVDKPFHNGAAKLAIVSLFALAKDKFWEMNDILFDISRQTEAINIRTLAEQIGFSYQDIKYVFYDTNLLKKLKKDIVAGLKHGLTGTPGFIIDNQVYLGRIPPEILNKYLRIKEQ